MTAALSGSSGTTEGPGDRDLELVLEGPDGPALVPWTQATRLEAQNWLPARELSTGPALSPGSAPGAGRAGTGAAGGRGALLLALGLLALAGAALAPRIKGSGPAAR